MLQDYPRYEYFCASLQLTLFMLGMGATLSRHEFVHILQRPKSLILGGIGQFAVTPLLAVVVNHAFGLSPGIAVGLILISAMPGGALSKVFTYVGKGNIALSVSLTVLGTVATIALVPLLLRLLAAEYVPSDFVMPVGAVVRDLLLYLLLPLVAGMGVSRYLPRQRHVISKVCIRVGFVVVAVMIVGALGSGRIKPGELGITVPLAIILFCLLCQQLTMLPFRLLRWPRADCLSVGIEVTMRNLNLALLIKALIFPATEKGLDQIADGALFVILFYAGTAMGLGMPLALVFRWRAARSSG